MIRSSTVLALAVVLIASVSLADVHTVSADGTKDFTAIQAAVDAASDGDVVLVWNGEYGDVVIDGKSVSIAARGLPFRTGIVTIRNVPAGEPLFVVQLVVREQSQGVALRLENVATPVWIEEVQASVRGTAETTPAVACLTDCSDVVFGRTWFAASLPDAGSRNTERGSTALCAVRSRLTFYDAYFEGGQGTTSMSSSTAGAGGTAVALEDCDVFLGASKLRGGVGGDVALMFCGPGDGGAALLLRGAASRVHAVATLLTPGPPGSPGSGCPSASAGPAVLDGSAGSSLREQPGEVPELFAQGGSFPEGTIVSLIYTHASESGQPLVALGAVPGTTTLAGLFGRLVVPTTEILWDPGPFAIPPLPVWYLVAPELPPGFGSAHLYLQPIELDPEAGTARLGIPTGLHVIDSSHF